MSIHHFRFAAPAYLLALLVVPLLYAFAVAVRRRRSRYGVVFTNLYVAKQLAPRPRVRLLRRRLPLLVLALALVTTTVAMARPTVRVVTSYRETLVILLADVSGSMQATDVRPTRLYATISAFRDLADRLPKQDKIALVTFSDNVEIVVPPTRDHNTLDHGLEVLSPEGGTALGEGVAGAVRLAVTTLAADGIHRTPGQLLPAVIVLESDGAQDRGTVTPFAAAQLAKKAGIRIDGVALGTRYGTITRGTGLLKESFPVPPSPGTVGMLASLTGGEAFDATTARTLDLTLRSLASGAGRHPTRSDIAPWFELAGAVLLVAGSAAALRLGAALP